jgi:SAM-dependent methyltransferase
MDLQVATPWERFGVLSDGLRNDAILELLQRHAPGARILEVGCGAGLLACVAARLGAREVFAVEPSSLWTAAARLVRENGLDNLVEVIHGHIETLAPREVDFAFCELLDADPFAGGLVEAMDAARRWLGPAGRSSPRRLQVWVALVPPGERLRGRDLEFEQIRRIGAQFDLCTRVLEGSLTPEASPVRKEPSLAVVSTPVLAYDLPIGVGQRPGMRTVEVEVLEPGPVGGAVVWFEAELDEGILFSNGPDERGGRGQLLCAWPAPRSFRAGDRVALRVDATRPHLEVSLFE